MAKRLVRLSSPSNTDNVRYVEMIAMYFALGDIDSNLICEAFDAFSAGKLVVIQSKYACDVRRYSQMVCVEHDAQAQHFIARKIFLHVTTQLY